MKIKDLVVDLLAAQARDPEGEIHLIWPCGTIMAISVCGLDDDPGIYLELGDSKVARAVPLMRDHVETLT